MEPSKPNQAGIQFNNGEMTSSVDVKVIDIKSSSKSDAMSGLENPTRPTNHKCGMCGWRPQWLQRFNKAPWLLVTLTAAVGIEAMLVTGFVTSTLTSIERRFQLRSRDLGIIISSYDVTSIILVLFVTFVGGRGNKPRWLGTGTLIVGVGALTYALPHVTTGVYKYATTTVSPTCGASGHTFSNGVSALSTCAEEMSQDGPSTLSKYMYIFMAGQTLMAIGALPLNTLGVSMLDESVSLEQTGLYMGIFFSVASLGPAVGYMLMGAILNIFTDFLQPFSDVISTSDPGWVGAWWMGFVIASVPSFLVAIPLYLFPRELPETQRIREEKESQVDARGGAHETEQPGFGSRPSDFIISLKYLAVNPTVMCTILGICADTMLVAGCATFMPKFTQNQFRVTASKANFLIGIAMLPGLSGGVLLGGLVTKKFNLKVRGMLTFAIVSGLFTIILFGTVLMRCPQKPVIGVTAGYDGQNLMDYTENNSLDVPCNADCGCSTDQYNPVCMEDGIAEYFDPCYAGCKQDYGNGTYGECECLRHFISANLSGSLQVERGPCTSECYLLPMFVLGAALLLFFHFLPSVALVNTLLRCVPDSQRPMALGVNSILNKLLGSTPGPILVGVMMDGACLQWQQTCTTDGQTEGACWIYNNENLSWRMFGLGLIMKVAAITLFSLAFFFYRPAATETMEEADEVTAEASCAALSSCESASKKHSRDTAAHGHPEEMVPLGSLGAKSSIQCEEER